MTHQPAAEAAFAIAASMRPRLIAVDDLEKPVYLTFDTEASMRPRLIAVDDPRAWLRPHLQLVLQ